MPASVYVLGRVSCESANFNYTARPILRACNFRRVNFFAVGPSV
jgi:hypothetical protein